MIDFSAVPVLDSTAAHDDRGLRAQGAPGRGAAVYIAGARPPIRRVLLIHGVRPPRVRFRKQLADAVKAAHRVAAPAEPVARPLPT